MGKDNGIFSYKPKTVFEIELINIYILARKSNGFGLEIEYQVVKDYCKEFDFDVLEVYRLLKSINQRVIN